MGNTLSADVSCQTANVTKSNYQNMYYFPAKFENTSSIITFFLEKESAFQREKVREWRHIVEVERVRQSLRER